MLRDFLLLCLVSNFMVPTISSGIKQWVPNFSFTDPRMWTRAHLPCADQLILFPAYFYALLDLPSSVTTRGLVLPTFGALILPSSGHVAFDPSPTTDCEDNARDSVAIFKRPERHFWYLSHNWREIDSYGAPLRINKAMPHMDRIPCAYDEVRFPPDRNFVVDLQLAPRLDVAMLQLHGQIHLPRDFQRFLFSQDGQMMFRNSESGVRLKSNGEDSEANICHPFPAEYYEGLLCHNEQKYCEVPHCLDPIKPKGFCCEICGAMLQVEAPSVTNLRNELKRIRIYFDENLRTLGEAHEIDYFVGLVEYDDQEGKLFIQLVITDVEEYDEKSTKLMRAFKDAVLHPPFDEGVHLVLSGRPYKPSEEGSFWNFIFMPLFFILAMFFTIYSYYYKVEDGKLNVLTWSVPVPSPQRLRSLFTSWNSQFIFARFENAHEDGQMSVAELQIQPGTSTDITVSPGEEIESKIHVVEEESEEVENLLQIDLDD